MSVLFLQVFVSLCLVAGAVVLYVFTVRESTFEHSDRLALAPLDDDERPAGRGQVPSKAVAPPDPKPEERS